MRWPGRADDLRPSRPVQRFGLVCHRLRQEVLFPRILRQRRLLLERQERRQVQIGWWVKRQRVKGQLLERQFLERELDDGKFVEGKLAQRFRQTQIIGSGFSARLLPADY